MKCPLKRLSLRSIEIEDVEVFIAFMNNFKDTLEELDFGSNFPDPVYDYVFKLPKLKLLKIFLNASPEAAEFYQKLRPNRTVKTLIIHSIHCHNYVTQLQHIIGSFPAIESLRLDLSNDRSVTIEVLSFIALNMLQLRVLQVNRIHNDAFNNVVLPSLRELHIFDHRDIDGTGWNAITESCPNIEKLAIHSDASNIFFLRENEAASITNHLRSLKHLSLGQDVIATKTALAEILSRLDQVRVEISKEAIDDNTSAFDEYLRTSPRLTALSSEVKKLPIDLDLWAGEFEVDSNSDSDMNSEFSIDMEIDEEDDYEDGNYQNFYGGEVDDNSDDSDFVGAFRPG